MEVFQDGKRNTGFRTEWATEKTLMMIAGINKTTLLDYPGHVAATLFLGGCNFQCPFCHNRDIVFADECIRNGSITPYTKNNIFAFLEKRKNVLTGVCVTGGEPTLHKDLPEFLQHVKMLGYQIKLDTNGTNPQMLELLINQKLIDYCAMDIKNAPEKYGCTIGLPDLAADSEFMTRIRESVGILMASAGVEFSYEFRTTVTQELHNENDMYAISEWISGANAYFLQPYVESEGVIVKGFHAPGLEMLEQFYQICKKTIPNTQIRGRDIS